MAIIELRDVNVSLGGNSILNDMSMSVEPGRVHALLGRNGAGRSTPGIGGISEHRLTVPHCMVI